MQVAGSIFQFSAPQFRFGLTGYRRSRKASRCACLCKNPAHSRACEDWLIDRRPHVFSDRDCTRNCAARQRLSRNAARRRACERCNRYGRGVYLAAARELLPAPLAGARNVNVSNPAAGRKLTAKRLANRTCGTHSSLSDRLPYSTNSSAVNRSWATCFIKGTQYRTFGARRRCIGAQSQSHRCDLWV